MNINLKDIESDTFILGLLNFLFLVVPGTAIIFVFNNVLFQSLDWVKLILLSVSVTSPLAMANTFIITTMTIGRPSQQKAIFVDFFLGVMLSGLLLFAVVLMNYFLGSSLKQGAIFILVVEVLLLLTVSVKLWRGKK